MHVLDWRVDLRDVAEALREVLRKAPLTKLPWTAHYKYCIKQLFLHILYIYIAEQSMASKKTLKKRDTPLKTAPAPVVSLQSQISNFFILVAGNIVMMAIGTLAIYNYDNPAPIKQVPILCPPIYCQF